MKRMPMMHEEIHGLITEERITIDTDNGSSWRNWSGFVRAKVEDDLVLLFLDKVICYPFPKTLFASDFDWTAFVELVKVKVPIK